MLNPELKKDIDVEIAKSEPLIQGFLSGEYFRETMDLVFKVNRLNEIQKESVELETILYILKLSNYENIYEAIKTECSIETENTAKQLSDDLEKYIFNKLYNEEALEGGIVKRIEISAAEAAPEEVAAVGVKNLINENFDIKNPRDLVKNTSASEVLAPAEDDILEGGAKLGDVYREKPDLQETNLKKEI
jgi:hypothetical protein